MRPKITNPTHATIIAYLALFVALGGSGYAATQSAQRGDVKVAAKKHKKKHKTSALVHCAATTVTCTGKVGPQGIQGPQGQPGQQGQPGAPGAPGAPGTARAYGLVLGDGTTPTIKKNIVAVSHTPGSGIYCITLAAGIDPTTTAAVATRAENADAGTGITTHTTATNCAPGQFEIDTFKQTTGSTNNADFHETDTDEPFFFAVP